MADYCEVDFHEVHTKKSGDAITLRYEQGGITYIHVVDGGYAATGPKLVEHINSYYGKPTYIDNVVVTHPDQDHAEGIQEILNTYSVGCLWMLLPWDYVDRLIDRFARYTNPENLKQRLRKAYPYLAELERIALSKGIQIREPFQGSTIGIFKVIAPTQERYFDLVVTSAKTPEEAKSTASSLIEAMESYLVEAGKSIKSAIRAAWGAETFPASGTSNENEMSVVQFCQYGTMKLVLTADTGRDGLNEAADYAPVVGLYLPGGVTHFQIPHHGGRHNVSTETLNRWFGEPIDEKNPEGQESFQSIVSAARDDEDHPRKVVVRAFIHRGARVDSTDDGKGTKRIGWNPPSREGWSNSIPLSYPSEMED